MAENKIKPLTEDEKKQIYDFIVVEKKTDEQIATIMKRHIETIANARKKMGINKTKGGKISDENTEEIKEILEKHTPKNKGTEKKQKISAWKMYFKTTEKYKRWEKKLDTETLKFVVEEWAEYHVQFEDLTPTEEDSIDLLIDFKIRLEDNRNQLSEAMQEEKRLRSLLGDKSSKELDLEDETQRWIFETIHSNNQNKMAINKDFKELSEKYEKIQRTLNGTREQREQNTKIGGDTFLTLCRDLNDADKRKAIGKTNEWLRLAKENSMRKMKKDHQYDDGVVEPVILDGADFIKEIGHEDSSDTGGERSDGLLSEPNPPKE